VIDPVLDFDPASGTVDDGSVEEILKAAADEGIAIEWVLETHVHADHLSGAPLIKARTGAKVAIGEHVRDVQNIFRPIFGADDMKSDGTDFDRLLRDGERFEAGGLDIEVIHTPGHTPACVSYKIDDAVFVGDTLFMPDYGTARTDFPGGCARQLYRSIRKLLSLPPETRLFMCHDYKAPGRDAFAWETTVAQQRRANAHIHDGIGEDEFVAMREERDRTLAAPKLLIPSIQVNMRAGRFPPAGQDGVRYLRVPVVLKEGADPEALG
jgi:glyoxylase-like metal-dependent hydrolase (beta-lactamase superfamily II)